MKYIRNFGKEASFSIIMAVKSLENERAKRQRGMILLIVVIAVLVIVGIYLYFSKVVNLGPASTSSPSYGTQRQGVGPAETYHSECRDFQCAIIKTEGKSTCSTDVDCSISIVKETGYPVFPNNSITGTNIPLSSLEYGQAFFVNDHVVLINKGIFVYDSKGDPLTGFPMNFSRIIPPNSPKGISQFPAVGDVNADGYEDFVFLAEFLDDGTWLVAFFYKPDEGTYVNGIIRKMSHYDMSPSSALLNYLPNPILSDINLDGILDILVVSKNNTGADLLHALYSYILPGEGVIQNFSDDPFPRLYDVRLSDLPGWPVDYAGVGNIAVGLDSNGNPLIADQSGNTFIALNRTGDRVWFKVMSITLSNARDATPVIGDVDNDGELEIVTTFSHNTFNGSIFIYDEEGNLEKNISLPFRLVDDGLSLADIDGDNDLEIFVSGRNSLVYYPITFVAYQHTGELIRQLTPPIARTPALIARFGDEAILTYPFSSNEDPESDRFEIGAYSAKSNRQLANISLGIGYYQYIDPIRIEDYDNDGKFEIVARSRNAFNSVSKKIDVFELDAGKGISTEIETLWPNFQHDPALTGFYS